MEIPKTYDPSKTEEKWYKYWMEKKFFHSRPDEREPYTVVIPPPNVTGVLHMGHMLNNTIQDVLVRKARMEGKNACWVPGTDHASIATEAKVVNKLRDQGIKKSDLSRDEFMKHAWEWTDKHGGIILDQLKKLGASCDWDRTRFTMEDDLYQSVIKVFIDLYKKGEIYRGYRMVNWDPAAKTALSDEEVIHKEESSKLYYLKYKVEGEEEWLTIATTRPETILGDTAVCVNPDDDRYNHLKGKKAIVPLVNRPVPIIEDDYVDMEFGTGCLKVTPAHDTNDYDLGQKHGLETIDIFNSNGTLNENAQLFVGKDRFEVRKLIMDELKSEGHFEKEEEIINNVGYSERTDVVIEPRLSLQWFCSMKNLSKPALESVMNDTVKFHPPKFKNTYKHWMGNIKDWCISRQLWWGHRIPAYFYGEGDDDYVVASSKEEALQLAKKKSGKDLSEDDVKQDEDVLDTWFSSWLWPISVFNGINEPDNDDIQYYYPSNDLVTAPEIMFFWVARMIIAGYEYKGEAPFKNVYYTGIVRDKKGRKMSKSLGNSPDPIELMNQYGADGVRVGMLLCSPAGNDLPFDVSLCEQGRNFSNKIWNALRLVKGWDITDAEQPESSKIACDWFESKLNEQVAIIEDHYGKFRISDALMSVYRLFWDDFCSWYLEMVKPAYQQPIDKKTLDITIHYFEELLKLLHPFMPFISEELWHLVKEREEKDCVIVGKWPETGEVDKALLEEFKVASEVINKIRNFKKDKNIPNKEKLSLFVRFNENTTKDLDPVIIKMGNLNEIDYIDDKPDGTYSFMVGSNEYFIPLAGTIDVEAEAEKLKKELEYNKGFLMKVEKKLSNKGFVDNAPEVVVEKEKKKKSDAEAKIKVLEEQLANLSAN